MKLISKLSLFITLVCLLTLISCKSNEITNVTLNKSALEINVGFTDSIVATISFSGDMDQEPITWVSSNPNIVEISESGTVTSKSRSGSNSYSKTILIRGLKEGATSVTIQAGEKTVSCNVKVGKQELNFNKAFVANYGDYYGYGTYDYELYMLSSDLSIDETTGSIIGNGTYLYIDFNVPLAQEEIIPGTFSMSETGKANTFFPGELLENTDGSLVTIGAQLITLSGSTSTTQLIKDGSYTISVSGDDFIFEGNFVIENNEEVYCYYQGKLNVSDLRESLTPTFTKGRLIYYGDIYDSKLSNNFIVELGTDSIVWSDSIWYGEILQIELNTPLTATDSIPNGKYKMMETVLGPFTLVPGYLSDENVPWGCWYFGYSNRNYNSGEVDVHKNGNEYTINFQLADANSRIINGTYTGSLSYINNSKPQSSALSAAKVKGIHQNETKFQRVFVSPKNRFKINPDHYLQSKFFSKAKKIKRK